MQAWNQWGNQATTAGFAVAGYQSTAAAAPPATAAAVAAPPAAYPISYQYYGAGPAMASATPDMAGYTHQQWNVVEQQQWQQWQQWQQQFQQWQQQYGDKYQESLNSLAVQSNVAVGPAAVDMANPPPLPPPDKSIPPPPPEETDAQPDVYRTSGGTNKMQDSSTGSVQDTYSNRGSGATYQTGDRAGIASHPMPYYGVPPPSKGTIVPVEFSKPPPVPDIDAGFGSKGNISDSYQSVKRPFEGADVSRDQFHDDTKKSRAEGYGSGFSPVRGEEHGGRGRGSRGGRLGAPTSKEQESSWKLPPEGDGTPQPVRAPIKDNPDELSAAERNFDIQFKQWEQQFNKWKEQNIDHPDKTQYREYEAQWDSWREHLLQRREQMRKKREASSKLTESSGNVFQSDNSSRGGIGSSAVRGRGRGRGGAFDRGGSNVGQDNFRGIPDPCNRGSGSFGGTHLPQEQNVSGGFRDQKSGVGASGDFGGCGVSQQDRGTKSGGSETSGNFGDHTVGQRSAIGGPNGAEHDSFGVQHAVPQHGFGLSSGPNQDSKSGPRFGGPSPSKQDSKTLHCGPNRALGDFGCNVSEQDCSALGNFGVPPPSVVQPDSKGMPLASHRGSGDFRDSPLSQKPPSMLSPTHPQQLTSAPKSSGDENKNITEGETPSDEKDKANQVVKLDFIKNAADGIPGLDLLAEQEKQKDNAKASAAEIALSVGHDIDERTSDKSINSNSFIGPVPAPTSMEQSNDQGLGKQGFLSGRPPNKLTFQQPNVQGFGSESKSSLNNQVFRPGSQNSPNVQGFSSPPRSQLPQGSGNHSLGPGGNKSVGNNENHPHSQNFGPGTHGPNQAYGIGNQGPNQSFGPENQGFNQSMGPGNQNAVHSQGFGPQNSMGSRGFGPDGNQGFGPNNQGFGPANQGLSHGFGPGNRGYGSKNQGSPGVAFQGSNQGFGPNNFCPQNNQGVGPDQFGGSAGPQSWGDDMDGYNRGGWNQGPSRFDGPGKANTQGMKDNFQGPRDSFQNMRDNFQGQRENFQGPLDRSQGPRDNFQGPRDNFFGPRDGFRGPQDNFQGPRENFQGPRDGGFQGPRESFQAPRDEFQGPRDGFTGPGDRFVGPRDNFGGPREAYQGSRDSFQGQSDRYPGQSFGDFGYTGESEFGRGRSHDFPPSREFQQEGGRGGFQDYGSEYGRGRGARGRARGKGGFGPPSERNAGDELSWQRGGGRAGGRFGPGTDDQRLQQPDFGSSAQMNKGPGPFGEDTDFPTEDRNFPPDVSHPTESDRAKWDREGESPFPREPYSRFGDPPSRKSWGSEEDVVGSTFPPSGNRDDRVGDFPKGGWGRMEERAQSWDHGSRSHDWNKDFELEPATVVDYGHRPAAVPGLTDTVSAVGKFPEPVQTFDYGHGAASRHMDIPNTDSWRRDDAPFRSGRDRDDRFHRERDRERDRDRDRDRERDRDRDREWDRDRGKNSWDQDRDSGKRESRWERDRGSRTDSDAGREDRGKEKWEDEDRYRNSGGDRWVRRDRERDGDRDNYKGSSGRYRESSKKEDSSHGDFPPPPDAPPPPAFTSPIPSSESQVRAVLVEDLLCPPGRATRPARLVIMLRGPPGSGKTFVAKLIKDKEVEMGGSAPRILALDDYFMVETEKEEKDPETGRKVITKVMEYEYEAAMEKHYRSSLLKAFRKTVNDGYFPFIIVDCVNHQVKHFEEMWSYAKQKGFQVYICEMDMDLTMCSKRNIHNRTEEDIANIIKNWEETPRHYLRVDVRSLLQSVAITEVEMEDTTPEDDKEAEMKEGDDGKEEDSQDGDEEPENAFTSKWERMEPSGDKLNRLDGLAKRRKTEDKPQTMEDWLQLTDDYDRRKTTPGKKMVRWADLEERREQEKMRAIGFVVGQTDWSRMTDPTFGESALTQTKYI